MPFLKLVIDWHKEIFFIDERNASNTYSVFVRKVMAIK
jgi:hypothetical protein